MNFKKLLAYKTSYLQAQFKGKFQQMVVFQNLFNYPSEILTELL